MAVSMLERKVQESEKLSGDRFPEETLLRLKHMIVSHHGEYEYGSPKLPMTVEAVALFCLDNLDAKVHTFQQQLRDDPNIGSRWTHFNANLGRKLFKGGAVRMKDEGASRQSAVTMKSAVDIDTTADCSLPTRMNECRYGNFLPRNRNRWPRQSWRSSVGPTINPSSHGLSLEQLRMSSRASGACQADHQGAGPQWPIAALRERSPGAPGNPAQARLEPHLGRISRAPADSASCVPAARQSRLSPGQGWSAPDILSPPATAVMRPAADRRVGAYYLAERQGRQRPCR